jgi:hypothetical protein
MEVFRFGIYLSVILFVVVHSDLVKAAKEVSAIILQVQSVPSGVSSEKMIECAFHLMKTSNSSFVRIPEGGDNCEQLARPSSMNSNFIEKDFEYLEKSAFYSVFDPKVQYLEYFIYNMFSVQHIKTNTVKSLVIFLCLIIKGSV